MPDEARLNEFGTFCLLKKGVNGPDVHMKAAGAGTEGAENREWKLAVYNNFCSTPSAAVVWAEWLTPEDIMADATSLQDWIACNWKGIPIRQNRRPARSVPKLTQSLVTLADWMMTDYHKLGEMDYEEAWKSLDDVYTWGRYVKIKFLETARRYLGHDHLVAPNIRAAGGWSPRRALALLYPEYGTRIANKDRNDKATLSFVYGVANDVRNFVSESFCPVSNYEFEALLCNYRQTLSERKAFYVGRTIDSELEYDTKVRSYWGEDPYRGQFDFFETRKAAFPERCLGEIQGWDGVRKDLSPLLRENGYVWSDVLYDYQASKDNLAHPVRWVA